ncbi:MAG: hypothetical protein LBJ08_12800, partial [Bifidobacteriaceae bacterium]|nr:hypothetical protein [Bifidobacteriaceae bacterium]
MTSTRPVLLLTRDDRLIASVGALAQDAGVRLTVAELPGAIPPPSAVLCGYDMPVAVAGEAAELNVPVAAVGFGRTPTDDGVPPVGPRYSLPQEAALLIAFLERSAGRTRTGLR